MTKLRRFYTALAICYSLYAGTGETAEISTKFLDKESVSPDPQHFSGIYTSSQGDQFLLFASTNDSAWVIEPVGDDPGKMTLFLHGEPDRMVIEGVQAKRNFNGTAMSIAAQRDAIYGETEIQGARVRIKGDADGTYRVSTSKARFDDPGDYESSLYEAEASLKDFAHYWQRVRENAVRVESNRLIMTRNPRHEAGMQSFEATGALDEQQEKQLNALLKDRSLQIKAMEQVDKE